VYQLDDVTDEWLPDESKYAYYDDFMQYNYAEKNRDSYTGIAEEDTWEGFFTQKMQDYGPLKADNLPMVTEPTEMDFDTDNVLKNSGLDEVDKEVDLQLEFAVVKCVFNLCFDTQASGYKVRMYTDDERNKIPYNNTDDCYKVYDSEGKIIGSKWSCHNFIELFNIYNRFYLLNDMPVGLRDLYGYNSLGFLTVPWTLYKGATLNEANYTSDTQYALCVDGAEQIAGFTESTSPANIPYQYTARYVCYLPPRDPYLTKDQFEVDEDVNDYAVEKKKTTLNLALKRFNAANNAAVDDGNGYFITVRIPDTYDSYTYPNPKDSSKELRAAYGLRPNYCYEYIINIKGTRGNLTATTYGDSDTKAVSAQDGWTVHSTRITEQ
jgi:hypothetical protein